MNWKAWIPYVLLLIVAILIEEFWHPSLTGTIVVLFIILTWILSHFERQRNDRLDRIEAELSKKADAPQPEPRGDLEGREELAEISNRLAAVEPSFTKQEVAIARQKLEFAQRLQQIENDLRELRTDTDNCWSTTASRYSIIGWGPALDLYTLEELKRAYDHFQPRDCVRLLRRLQSQRTLPYELAALAVKDSNSEVREWFARCGDFSPWISRKFQVELSPDLAAGANKNWCQPQEAHIADANFSRELVQIVLNDPDPFVRACLRENPTAFYGLAEDRWLKYFRDTDHLGRLALLRNTEVANGLVEKIFNLECSELAINLNERIDLGLAFLSNAHKLHELKDEALLCDQHHPFNPSPPAPGLADAETFLAAIWKHSSKWPRATGIPAAIYRSVAAARSREEQCLFLLRRHDPEILHP